MATTTPTAPAAPAEASPSRAGSSVPGRPSPAGRSLRNRIVIRFVVVLAIATVASVLFQRHVLLTQLEERVDADLMQEVTELQRLVGGRDAQGNCLGGVGADGDCEVGRNPETGEPFGDDVEAVFDTFLRRNIPSDFETMITFVGGRPYKVPAVRLPYAHEADEALYHLAGVDEPRRGHAATAHGRIRYLAVPVMGTRDEPLGVFVVSQFLELQRNEVEESLWVITLMGLAVLVVASLLVYQLTGRVLAPVQEVRETAQQISESDLRRRIDVTGTDEIAALARTFNQMLDRLETAFITQRNFVDDAGHELRTPITIIRGHLELLGDDPDEREETVAIVTDELDRMTRMVDDLLVLAKAERPDFLTLGTVDVAALTEDLHTKASALAPRDWQLEQVGRGIVVADRQRLTQAVMQLAQNATQHTGEGQTISLGSAVTDGEARLWVRDSGPGVAPDDAEKIFERFSRGTTRRTEGAGLGLSIVRAIAEAHAGRVELHSHPGEGATFTLVIPVDPPATAQEATP